MTFKSGRILKRKAFEIPCTSNIHSIATSYRKVLLFHSLFLLMMLNDAFIVTLEYSGAKRNVMCSII